MVGSSEKGIPWLRHNLQSFLLLKGVIKSEEWHVDTRGIVNCDCRKVSWDRHQVQRIELNANSIPMI